jgi:hypothetical protein
MKKLGIVLILSILLVSCFKTEPIGKYQAVVLTDYDRIIIINTTNGDGEVFEIRKNTKEVKLSERSKKSF